MEKTAGGNENITTGKNNVMHNLPSYEIGSNAGRFCVGAYSRMVLQGVNPARLHVLLDPVGHV